MRKTIFFFAFFILVLIAGAQNVGIGTPNPLARLHITDSSVLFSASGSASASPGNPPTQGAGRRMLWYADKSAFRVGYVDGTQWDMSNIGTFSFAGGVSTIASGSGSLAFGQSSTASGNISAVFGNQTVAKAANSFTIGQFNETSTDNASPFLAISTDRLFQIGSGTSTGNRSNAMTVLRNGNVGIGLLIPTAKLDVNGQVAIDQKNFGGNAGLLIRGNIPGSNYPNIGFSITNQSNNDVVGAVISGELVNNVTGSESIDLGFYTTSSGLPSLTRKFLIQGNGNAILSGTLTQNSDVRLKTSIKHLNVLSEDLQKINGYTYHWQSPDRDQSRQIGLLAQEVQKVYPELVKEDDKGILSINYSGLIPVLLEAIKDQQKRIEMLEQKIAAVQK